MARSAAAEHADDDSRRRGAAEPGRSVSGAVPARSWTIRALPGYVEGNTTYAITKNTNYTVCPGSSAAQGCVVNAKIAPTQITSSISVPLDPAGTTLTPRTNQLDIGLAKRFLFGRVRVSPKVDKFRALNPSLRVPSPSPAFTPAGGPGGPPAPPRPPPAPHGLSRACPRPAGGGPPHRPPPPPRPAGAPPRAAYWRSLMDCTLAGISVPGG